MVFPGKALAAAAVLCLSIYAEEPAPTEVQFLFTPEPGAGMVTLKRADGPETLSVPLRQGSASVRLNRSTRWNVETKVAGWWAPAEVIVVGRESPMLVERRIWKTGALEGAVRLEKDAKATQLRISVEDMPFSRNRTDFPRTAAFDCPVVADGTWSCEVPRGVIDLAIRVPGHAPAYRWAVEVGATPRDLGVVQLRAGASVSGWVTSDEKTDLSAGKVSLVRAIGQTEDPVLQQRLGRPVAEAAIRKDGFFQLTGVAEGRYRLEAEREGFARAVLAPLEVRPGVETAIRAPLRLSRPHTIRLQLQPARDWLDRSWHVRVEKLLDYSLAPEGPAIVDAPVDALGTIEVPGQGFGTFRVTVSDATGNRLLTDTFVMASEVDATRTVDVNVVRITGNVLLGTEPVAAEVWFGGQYGSQSIGARSGEDGEFEAVLPRDGKWLVEVRPAGRRRSTEVTLQVDARDGVARVTIELPRSTVFGRVTDHTGRPLQGADVAVVGDSVVSGVTGPDGSFRLDSVPGGKALLRAAHVQEGTRRVTEPLTIDVAADGETGPFELKVMPSRRIQARVVSPRGPVVGAAIRVTRATGAPLASITTDLEGAFSADVPASDENAIVIVSPPGHAFRAFRVPSDGREVVVHVPETGGTIVLHGAPGGITVTQDGMLLAIQDLVRWSISHGIRIDADPTRMVFPNLSAGVYRFCAVQSAGCREVTLAPGGEVDVRF